MLCSFTGTATFTTHERAGVQVIVRKFREMQLAKAKRCPAEMTGAWRGGQAAWLRKYAAELLRDAVDAGVYCLSDEGTQALRLAEAVRAFQKKSFASCMCLSTSIYERGLGCVGCCSRCNRDCVAGSMSAA
jgi:hypothetical protein